MSRQRSLFPHLDGAAGSRKAAVLRRWTRARHRLAGAVEDLYWLAERCPARKQDIYALIDDIEAARSGHIPSLNQQIAPPVVTKNEYNHP